MKTNHPSEYGITHTVNTFFSQYTLLDVIDIISAKKVDAVLKWLDEQGINPENSLIIGTYLTGARLANCLVKKSHVTVLDIYPHLQSFLDPGVSFTTQISDVDNVKWDFIIDTSGLGGINPDDILRINQPAAFLVEDPTSDGSDEIIISTNQSQRIIKTVNAPKSGLLYTSGLSCKTSGTMTLGMGILCRAMQDALKEKGVLYSTSSMEFYERILFKQNDPEKFIAELKKTALIVSSLNSVNCNQIIDKNLLKLKSQIKNYRGGTD